jgi:hypothetical protein
MTIVALMQTGIFAALPLATGGSHAMATLPRRARTLVWPHGGKGLVVPTVLIWVITKSPMTSSMEISPFR